MTKHSGQFKKGEPRPANSGRRAGTPNKRTVFVKGIIEEAVIEMGGAQRLVEWCKEDPKNEYAFWTSMFMRLIPVQVKDTAQNSALPIEIRREDVARKRAERGLPPIVFGVDLPKREGEGGNGKH